MKSEINFIYFAIISIAFLLANCTDSNSQLEETMVLKKSGESSLSGNSEKLSIEEIEGLYFMREEEKLARDVYINLNNEFPHQTFENIQKSEQRHTDAILHLINLYGLEDPALEEIGVFADISLQNLYDDLMLKGEKGLDSALFVGAIIEETDIIDIEELAHETEVANIIQVYDHLLLGSENHLRAFVHALKSIGIEYTPLILTEERFNEIINNE